jgi:hypothetical protein
MLPLGRLREDGGCEFDLLASSTASTRDVTLKMMVWDFAIGFIKCR